MGHWPTHPGCHRSRGSAAAPRSGPAGPEPGEFQTTLAGGDGYQPEVLLDRDVAAAFRLKPVQAEAVVREVSAALAPRRDVAAKHGATRSEVELGMRSRSEGTRQ